MMNLLLLRYSLDADTQETGSRFTRQSKIDGILDLVNKKKIALDCVGRLQLAYEYGLATGMTAQDYSKLKDGQVEFGYNQEWKTLAGTGFTQVLGPWQLTDLVPGDWVTFWNHPSYGAKHPRGAWHSENAVFIRREDKDFQFIAGGMGEKEISLESIIVQLWAQYNKPSPPGYKVPEKVPDKIEVVQIPTRDSTLLRPKE
jgi:hypothetical protein